MLRKLKVTEKLFHGLNPYTNSFHAILLLWKVLELQTDLQCLWGIAAKDIH